MSAILQAHLPPLEKPVFRLGLSASYRPGENTVRRALDEGVNYFFCYGFDSHLIRVLRSLNQDKRDRVVIATGAYNYLWGRQNFRKTFEKRLRQLRTDYLDVFLYLGIVKPAHFGQAARDELQALREDPRVRSIGISCHHRKFAAEMAVAKAVDILMLRYNAAHRGAEVDIFPSTMSAGITSYTATCWTQLLRRPRGWAGPVPTAGQCYRFQLSHPAVAVGLTAPTNESQLMENLAAVRQGPLPHDEMQFMRTFGDVVHG